MRCADGLTLNVDAQLNEGLLHHLALPLAHEAVVDVDGDHLLLVQGFVEQSRAHGGIHPAAQQHLGNACTSQSLPPSPRQSRTDWQRQEFIIECAFHKGGGREG